MEQVNIHEAKTNLSRLIAQIKAGEEAEIVIAQNGVPAARLVPIEPRQKIRWGLAKGKYVIPDTIDALNPEIEKMFYGDDD